MFNNDNFFDPSITRKTRSSETLPQLTGFIQVICTNQDLQFNNERTDLIKNSFNELLKANINDLNKKIQLHGKTLLKEIELQSSGTQSSGTQSSGTQSVQNPSMTPYINLIKTRDNISFSIESPPIDVKKYFDEAKDSKGNSVLFNCIFLSI